MGGWILDIWDTPTRASALVQISRFLVVDPRQRYTACEALAHPFFQQYDVEEVRHFSPFRKFKVRLGLGVSQRPEPGSCRSRAVGCVSQLSWEKLGVQGG